jgi:predicted transcriptional regulator
LVSPYIFVFRFKLIKMLWQSNSVMTPLPDYRPKQLAIGPLEAEILNIIWELGDATVKDVHDRILADPERELAYTSVTTVLRRLTEKGWLACDKKERTFSWRPLISRQQAQVLKAHDQLQRFLAVGNPDVVAAFADSLDYASLEQLEAIAKKIQAARRAQEEE